MNENFDISQEGRWAFMRKCLNKGFFEKVVISPQKRPHVWVAPSFYTLEFDAQQEFVSVVYAYNLIQKKKHQPVVVIDQKTGKKIGVFGKKHGGLKMNTITRGITNAST